MDAEHKTESCHSSHDHGPDLADGGLAIQAEMGRPANKRRRSSRRVDSKDLADDGPLNFTPARVADPDITAIRNVKGSISRSSDTGSAFQANGHANGKLVNPSAIAVKRETGREAEQAKAVSSSPSSASPSTSSSSSAAAKHKHVKAIHAKVQPSCLSYQDTTSSPDFWGFRNILILMVVVSNLRLILENFRKYGILICVRCHSYQSSDLLYGSILYFSIPCHLFIALMIEKYAAKRAKDAIGLWKKDKSPSHAQNIQVIRDKFKRDWWMIALAQAINVTLSLAVTSYIVYYHIHHPGIGTICELHSIIVWLKVSSYTFTNRDLRDLFLSPATPESQSELPDLYKTCPYPNNITLSNLCYFWWAPTLVYQPVYPRTDKIRWNFVAKRFAEVGSILVVIWIMSAQYAVPLLVNSLTHFSSLDVLGMAERLLKLSTISLFIWLAGFFAIFQSFLNGLAEIMRFGDREFYSDWWNAPNLRTYWTSWNKPVYCFMKRHVYTPLVGRGVSSAVAQILVFTFSGVLHELLVGIPTHNVIGVAFAGMLWQIPLIMLTDLVPKIPGFKGYSGKVAGNMIFWLFFTILGQPLAALLYFYAWQAKYGSVANGTAREGYITTQK